MTNPMTNPKLADELTALAEKATALLDTICTHTNTDWEKAREHPLEALETAHSAAVELRFDHLPPILAALTARSDGWREGVEAAAKALEADAQLCDCHAHSSGECACGAWDDYKSITAARAIEIVRELIPTPPETTP